MSYNEQLQNMDRALTEFRNSAENGAEKIRIASGKLQTAVDYSCTVIQQFKTEMTLNEMKQLAADAEASIREELKSEQYRVKRNLRKIVLGVVHDFDFNLVRNSTIEELAQKYWLQASRYWLSFAFIAIAAWLHDKEERANVALREGLRRDAVKTSLFFCFMNLRFGETKAAGEWYKVFLQQVEPDRLPEETEVLLKAYLDGVFQDCQLKEEVSDAIHQWMQTMEATSDTGIELRKRYQNYLIQIQQSGKKADGEEWPYLQQNGVSNDSDAVKKSWAEITSFTSVIQWLAELSKPVPPAVSSYQEKIDELLKKIIEGYDDDEQEHYEEMQLYQAIQRHDGNVEEAKKELKAMQNRKKIYCNIGQLMCDWVIDKDHGTAPEVRRFGFEHTRSYFLDELNRLVSQAEKNLPDCIYLSIDNWTGVSTKKNESEIEQEAEWLAESMEQFYTENSLQNKIITPVNMATLAVGLVSLILSCFWTPYALAGVAAAAVVSICLALQSDWLYQKRRETAKQRLSGTMSELKRFWGGIRKAREQIWLVMDQMERGEMPLHAADGEREAQMIDMEIQKETDPQAEQVNSTFGRHMEDDVDENLKKIRKTLPQWSLTPPDRSEG